MSLLWVIRIAVILALYCYLFFSRHILQNRETYQNIVESGPLNILFVALYNGLCYLAVIIPSDPHALIKPAILATSFIMKWYSIQGQVLVIGSAFLLIYTITKRKAIGAQDTAGMILTRGLYAFCRHPIYVGIVLLTLGLAVIRLNFDGMIVFPLVFLANGIQAKLEEKYDMEIRFKEEYISYKKQTRMFGPFWFWAIVMLLLIMPMVMLLFR